MKLSKMQIGDLAVYNGDVVKLNGNGKQGGCEHDLWLALICTIKDKQTLADHNIDLDNLEELEIDTEEVSI